MRNDEQSAGIRSVQEALASLDAAERARVVAHVAALVAMPLKRRNAILGLTE